MIRRANPLTDRQAEVLGVIRAYQSVHDSVPSAAALGRQLGISPSAAHCHLQALIGRGYLEWRGRWVLASAARAELHYVAHSQFAKVVRRFRWLEYAGCVE
jgi:predicted ArsR family transcriptional regulator